MSISVQFIEQIRSDLLRSIEDDAINLPTLPEVALEIRDAANDPDIEIAALAAIIEHDSSIAARLIRVANSSLMRGLEPTYNVKGAISRIGLGYTSTMVTTLAMQQIFLSSKEVLNKRMRALWMHSADAGAICHTLARGQRHLKPELATLAGVVHQIGSAAGIVLCGGTRFSAGPSGDAGSGTDCLDTGVGAHNPRILGFSRRAGNGATSSSRLYSAV